MKPVVFTDKDLVRFWDKVAIRGGDDCWEWLSYAPAEGYGRFGTKCGCVQAHRFAYTQVFGAIPSELLVCHKCDNPRCVNPNHLFVGTHTTNARDREAKARGRIPDNTGEANGSAKLTEPDILAIREAYDGGHISYTALALRYKVSRRQIVNIVRRKSWSHL